jgi:hypothetical protein
MHISTKKFFLLIPLIILFTSLYALEDEEFTSTITPVSTCIISNEKDSNLKYYSTHLVTGGLAHLSFLLCGTLGFFVGHILVESNLQTFIGRKLSLTPPDLLVENFRAIFATGITPFIIGCLAGWWIIYKTPQWTDNYLLNSTKLRSKREKVETFLARIFLPYPVGVLLSEWCIAQKNKNI